MMTKKERIQAAIAGEKPDKLPYSFWTHLPGIDLNPELLAEKKLSLSRLRRQSRKAVSSENASAMAAA